MTTTDKAEFASPGDLKALFGIGRTSVYAHIAAGDFRAVKLGAKTLIDLESVRSYLATLSPVPARPVQARALCVQVLVPYVAPADRT